MTWLRALYRALRSLLASALATAVIYSAHAGGSALASLVGARSGGSHRLAWDMGCVIASVVLATAVPVRIAPGARRIHAIVIAAMALLVEGWSVLQLDADWPLRFTVGIVGTLSLQVAAGAWLGGMCDARRRQGLR